MLASGWKKASKSYQNWRKASFLNCIFQSKVTSNHTCIIICPKSPWILSHKFIWIRWISRIHIVAIMWHNLIGVGCPPMILSISVVAILGFPSTDVKRSAIRFKVPPKWSWVTVSYLRSWQRDSSIWQTCKITLSLLAPPGVHKSWLATIFATYLPGVNYYRNNFPSRM